MHVVSLRQVAKEAGVSVGTASQLLHRDDPRYSPTTRDRVRAVAQRLGYRVNTSARAIRQKRFGCISLLLSTVQFRSILPGELLDGIHDALAARGLHLNVCKLPDAKLVSEGFVPKLLRESLSDGLLINYNAEIPPAMIELIQRYRLPAIWLNSRQAQDCVYFDDAQGAALAVQYLLDQGHRRIGYARFTGQSHYSAADRAAGYRAAMTRAGLACDELLDEDIADHRYLEASWQWLARPHRLTAVLAYTPETLWQLHRVATERLGLRVPEDLALISFSPVPIQHAGLRMPTVLLPERAMGERAVELLVQKIQKPAAAFGPVALPCELRPVSNEDGPVTIPKPSP